MGFYVHRGTGRIKCRICGEKIGVGDVAVGYTILSFMAKEVHVVCLELIVAMVRRHWRYRGRWTDTEFPTR